MELRLARWSNSAIARLCDTVSVHPYPDNATNKSMDASPKVNRAVLMAEDVEDSHETAKDIRWPLVDAALCARQAAGRALPLKRRAARI